MSKLGRSIDIAALILLLAAVAGIALSIRSCRSRTTLQETPPAKVRTTEVLAEGKADAQPRSSTNLRALPRTLVESADVPPEIDQIPQTAPPKDRSVQSGLPVEPAERLKTFDRIVEHYFRNDLPVETQVSINKAIGEFNEWTAQSRAELDKERGNLEQEAEDIRRIEQEVARIDAELEKNKPSRFNRASAEAYNTLAKERNELAGEHRRRLQLFETKQVAYNNAVEEFHRQTDAVSSRIETGKQEAGQNVETWREWRKSRQDLAFFSELNRFYASLHRRKRTEGAHTDLQKQIDQVKALRKELGEYTRQKQANIKNGMIIVEVELCGKERCFMIVDTGASIVTVSPALVEVLGLEDRLGEEVEVMLAGGIRTKGPELIIPRLSILGKQAGDVESVVLNESSVGVDGLLGQSFLKQFDYLIDDRQDPKLILRPRTME